MKTVATRNEFRHLFRSSKKCELLNGLFYTEVSHEKVVFNGKPETLKDKIIALLEVGNIQVVKLGANATTMHAIWAGSNNGNPTAFYKYQPIFGEFIIADIWDKSDLIESVDCGELRNALSAFGRLDIPNLENKTFTILP